MAAARKTLFAALSSEVGCGASGGAEAATLQGSAVSWLGDPNSGSFSPAPSVTVPILHLNTLLCNLSSTGILGRILKASLL